MPRGTDTVLSQNSSGVWVNYYGSDVCVIICICQVSAKHVLKLWIQDEQEVTIW